VIPLSGQRVVITGAAQGLGAAIARVFARAGADLVLVDLSAEGLAEVGAACGGRAKLITADLADAEATRAALAEITDGPVHTLIHNAAILQPEP